MGAGGEEEAGAGGQAHEAVIPERAPHWGIVTCRGETEPDRGDREQGRARGVAGAEEGAVVGISGGAIAPISFLTLAKVGNLGVHVSGNGGPVDYMAAAHFLALGTKTVQFCTIVETFGYRIIEELCSGLSHLMAARGIGSMKKLIGIALPEPIRDFMELTPVKQISTVDEELCIHCGNCTRCPYLAISLSEKKIPETDPERCIGCGMCTFLCPSGAMSLRDRTEEEAKALKED